MSRIVSVWLPRWPILRFLAVQASSAGEPVDPARPFVLAADVSGTPCIAALNAAAEAEGIKIGETIAAARGRARQGRDPAGGPRRSGRRRCGAAAARAVGDALHARRLALGREERRRRLLSRRHGRLPLVRRRGETARRSRRAAPAPRAP